MKLIRQWKANKAWKERLSNPSRKANKTFAWTDRSSMMVLVDMDDFDALSCAKDFAQAQRKKGRIVKVLMRTAAKSDEGLSPDTWTSKQLSYNRLPKPEAEASYLAKHYDVVIHCSLVPFLAFDYLVAGLDAKVRIAAYDDAIEAYDLVVVPGKQGLDGFLDYAIKHLNLLSQKKYDFQPA